MMLDLLRLLLHGEITEGDYVRMFKLRYEHCGYEKRDRADACAAMEEVGIEPDPHGQKVAIGWDYAET